MEHLGIYLWATWSPRHSHFAGLKQLDFLIEAILKLLGHATLTQGRGDTLFAVRQVTFSLKWGWTIRQYLERARGVHQGRVLNKG